MKTLRILPALFIGAALTACPTAPKPDPIPPSPKVVSFTASPATVAPGGEVTLDWKVTDATKVTITDVDKGDLSGIDDQASGSVKVVPTGSTLYVLTALNDRGAKATAFVSVTVKGADADQLLFGAYPRVISGSQTATLVWSAPGANVVTITPMGGAALDLAGQVQSGSVAVSPTDTETTYTLDADGQTRTVTVTHAPEVTSLALSKPVALPDEMITVSWQTAHATKVSLSSPGFGTLFESTTAADVAMGSFTQAVPSLPNGTVLNFVLDVEGPGGSVRQVAALVLGNDPLLTSVTAPQFAKQGSQFTIAWTAVNADAVEIRSGGTAIYRTSDVAEAASGSLVLGTPAAATTYTVAAIAYPSGFADTRDVTVAPVGDVTITTFTAAPTTVANGGDAVTLTWDVSNARELRILEDGELTVVWKTGATAGTGTTTVYPNKPTSRFTLSASNTLDAPSTANADVTVSTVAELQPTDGGLVLEQPGTVEVGFQLGTEIEGLPLSMADVSATSTGFDDISATGQRLEFAGANDSTVEFAVPGFETWLYGQRLLDGSNVSVCTNGFMTLRGSTLTAATAPMGFPGSDSAYDKLLAPFWADLQLGPNGNVYWQVKGEAPNQVLIVQWNQLQYSGASNSVLTFEVKVTQTGVITYEYQTLNGLPSGYSAATAIQGSSGHGLAASPTAGGSIRFFGPTAAPVTIPTAALPVGGFVKLGSGFARVSLSRFLRSTDIAITEVLFTPAASVPNGEWFEVANSGTASLDLNGWVIDFGGGVTHTIASSVTLPAGGTILLGQSDQAADNDGVNVVYAYGADLLANGAGQVALVWNGTTVASKAWTGTVGSAGNAVTIDGTPVLTTSGLAPLQCTSTATFGTQMPQQTGTPGVASSCFGYKLTPIPAAFDDISSGGTPIFVASSNPDWTTTPAAIDLPTPFTYFGTAQPRMWVSASSWLAFTSQSSGVYTNRTTPSLTTNPVGAIAPFWDDTENIPAVAGSNVFWARRADHTVIEWSHFTHWLGSDDLNYEVKLFDNGAIEFHYGTMTSTSSSTYGNGNSATIWIERPSGTASALPIGVNQAVINPNTAYRFTPTP